MKKIYFFRSDLNEHFYLYYSWINAAKSRNEEVLMLTVLDLKQLFIQYRQYKEVKKHPNLKVVISPHRLLNHLFSFVFIGLQCLKNEKVSLVGKKVNLKLLRLLKRTFGSKFVYKIELEGDLRSEINYLKEHPYQDGFYDKLIENLEKSVISERETLKAADGLLVVSSYLKSLLLQRYEFLDKRNIHVFSTGFIKGRFYFDQDIRCQYRTLLEVNNEDTLFIYTGNLRYSWQNIKDSLVVFKEYLEKVNPNSKFLILTNVQDFNIAHGFVHSMSVPINNVIVKNVPNSEVFKYLNAADIGVLLRKNAVMNEVSSPGKIGEYAACGLPILTTKYLGDYSKALAVRPEVVQLADTINKTSALAGCDLLARIETSQRKEFSSWSNENLSSEANVDSFVNAF